MSSIEKKTVVGIGSALVDLLLSETDAFLEKVHASKGGMNLVDADKIEEIVGLSTATPELVPGGSACNTIIGIGRLGGKARFVGKRGEDQLGKRLEMALSDNNVHPDLLVSDSPTGRVLSIITPDAQRSMFTYLGASAESTPDEIRAVDLSDAAVVHIEGYLLFNPELIKAALETAKAAEARVSLDLASYTVVEASREILDEIVDNYVDILIANEDEALAFTGESDEEKALSALAERADIAVLKVGPRGSFIAHEGDRHKVGILGDGGARDTTGAGDLWASGFIHGLVNGLPLDKCGELGAACGYEVCQVVGAHIPAEGWERIRKSSGK
jgi:sugar/nucleoside kinase (ribokinase family)